MSELDKKIEDMFNGWFDDEHFYPAAAEDIKDLITQECQKAREDEVLRWKDECDRGFGHKYYSYIEDRLAELKQTTKED